MRWRNESKLKIEHISGSTAWNFIQLAFGSWLRCRTLAFISFKTFFKNKKRSGTSFFKIKRGLELVSQPYFLHDLWRKIFLKLYSINWPNCIVRMLLLLMCIVIIWFPVYDVIEFSTRPKQSRRKFKYLKNEKSF